MQRQQLPVLLLLLLVLVSCLDVGAAGSAAYDCAGKGCSNAWEPVCGQDGATYASACLAVCQGVPVARRGACGSSQQQLLRAPATAPSGALPPKLSFQDTASSRSSSTSSSSSSGSISAQQMHRFRRQGFTLVGQAAVGAFDPGAGMLQQQQQTGGKHTQQTAAQSRALAAAGAAVRIAADGLVYVSRAPVLAARPAGSSSMSAVSRQRPPFESGSEAAAATAAVLQQEQQQLSLLAPASGRRRRRRLLSLRWQPALQLLQVRPGSGRGTNVTTTTAAAAAGSSSADCPQEPHHLLLPALTPGGHSQQQQQQQQQQQVQRLLARPPARALQFVFGTDTRREFVAAPPPQQASSSAAPSPAAGGHSGGSGGGSGAAAFWPYSAIGQFLYAKGSCTGVMIGPGSVLTAAHCVWSRQRNMFQDKMVFIPFRHRSPAGVTVEPFGRLAIRSATLYPAWTNSPNTTEALAHDLAVVTLVNRTIGHKTGFLGLAWSPEAFTGVSYTAGYPGDKPRGSLWQSSCWVRDFGGSDPRFLNTCDTAAGQSGAPLWERRGAGTYLLRGVMSHEVCTCCSPDCACCSNRINGATKVTEQHYANVLKWRSQ